MLVVPWKYEVAANTHHWIMPDGCRDIIVIREAGEIREAFLSPLDYSARTLKVSKGECFHGYRLRPGINLDSRDITALVRSSKSLMDDLRSLAEPNKEIHTLIDELASNDRSISHTARMQGISLRTLQRYFSKNALAKPEFWRLLGRARRAAHAFWKWESLAEIAAAYGYSDQAHMTREFMRWFGTTPAVLRQDPVRLNQICQSGLGNWTGEQISTR